MNNKCWVKGHIPWNKGVHIYLGGKRFERGHKTWNKGLTKETSEIIKEYAQRSEHKVNIICLGCKKKFEVPLYRKETAKYCSKACHARTLIAGKYMTGIAWNKGQKFPQYSGKNSSQWKGGLAKKTIAWRTYIFNRDDYTCALCGQRGKRLNAHHIVPQVKFPQFRFTKGNGVTLCALCHWKIKSKEFLYVPKFLNV